MFAWYSFFCPSCGKTYARSLSSLLLGPGHRRCKKCSRLFDDGSREWSEMTPCKKFEFLFPATVLGYVGGAALAGIAGFLIGWPDWPVLAGLMAFSFFCYPLDSIFHPAVVADSKV